MSHGLADSAFLAEAMALRDGLRLAWERGYRCLLCESVCKELVNNLDDMEWVRVHVHRATLSEIQDMLRWNLRVELSWVAWEGYMVAYWLAKRGPFLPTTGIHEIEVPHSELKILLLKDFLSVV